jgi:hypothetical protein
MATRSTSAVVKCRDKLQSILDGSMADACAFDMYLVALKLATGAYGWLILVDFSGERASEPTSASQLVCRLLSPVILHSARSSQTIEFDDHLVHWLARATISRITSSDAYSRSFTTTLCCRGLLQILESNIRTSNNICEVKVFSPKNAPQKVDVSESSRGFPPAVQPS